MSTKKSGTSWQDTISDWLVSIIVAVALAFCIRTFVVEPYMVEGTSMYPTLESHERLIVSKYKYFFTEPKKGEIVVFRYPKDESRDFIKRVIATGGDTIVAAFDGKVRIVKYERRGYGKYVVIRHDNGLETVYGHLSNGTLQNF